MIFSSFHILLPYPLLSSGGIHSLSPNILVKPIIHRVFWYYLSAAICICQCFHYIIWGIKFTFRILFHNTLPHFNIFSFCCLLLNLFTTSIQISSFTTGFLIHFQTTTILNSYFSRRQLFVVFSNILLAFLHLFLLFSIKF